MMRRWAIFISGTGSNMVALLEKQNLAHVSLVVSSTDSAYGLQRAKRRSIPTMIFDTKAESWNELIETLKSHDIDSILLAGFMKILPKDFIQAFEGRIFNIHPSILPDYPGIKSIERAFADKKDSGCSFHVVDEGVDTGQVLLQKKVSLQENLAWTELMVHIQEHKLVRKSLELGSA
jgi:phosphoribosylglycinamide formyltransferase-1